MKVRIVSWQAHGLIVKGRWAGRFTLTYGEILTAERPIRGTRRGLILHTRTEAKPIRLVFENSERPEIEDGLRRRGVRIVEGHPNPQVPSKPFSGGGGNRTHVRSRTG